MSDFCTITPTRGDRPQFLEFCKYQLSRMDPRPERCFFIDRPPKLGLKDITARVREGVAMAKAEGFDKVYIMEDDDFYPKDYFEQMAFDGDFVGTTQTVYYHIMNRTWEQFTHPDRASLFNTGFRISALNTFKWPSDDVAFLDLRLWRYQKRALKSAKMVNKPVGVGIKHGVGLSGGSCHRRLLKRADPDLRVLKSMVDQDAFEFYENLITSSK